MYIKYFSIFYLLLNCIALNAQNKVKTVIEIEYKISKLDSDSSKKDTLCEMLGCFNIKNYDQKGKQIDLISYNKNNKIVFKTIIKYLKNGNLNEIKTYNSKNEITFRDNYIYKDNKLIRLENYRATNFLNFYQKYVYKNNNLTFIEKYQRDNKILSREYIENGRTTKIIEFGNYGFSTITYKLEYNKAGLTEKKQRYRIKDDKSEELLETETFVYDNKNNLLETSIKSNFHPSESHKYEYDNNENWIKKINLNNGAETITERKIEYY